MNDKVLVIGYGSSGRRHAAALTAMGIRPCVLTRHPGPGPARFIGRIEDLKNEKLDSCIICSPSASHLKDFERAISVNGLKKVLIEKPLESTGAKAQRIIKLAKKNNIRVYVAYNLRFLRGFELVRKFLRKNAKSVRLVEALAGLDLRAWRPGRKIEETYSARRSCGGGVDLDLSHEVDYLLWLFGAGFKSKFMLRRRISVHTVDSPDICKLVLDYGGFIADVTLDYIRAKKERYLKIACDNRGSLYFDLIKGRLEINGRVVVDGDDINKTYKIMLKAFLNGSTAKLCPLPQAQTVLRVLGV